MKCMASIVAAVVLGISGASALAQGGNPDFRLRSEFRTPDNGAWGANQSLGNAEFRVRTRFVPTFYYGGVSSVDNFLFTVQIDFRGVTDFATGFAGSPYNTSYDLYINNQFVGRVPMGSASPGLAALTFSSRLPVAPELPLPFNWPTHVSIGSEVRAFAAAPTLPAIRDPFPVSGTPLFVMSTLEERFARGDANQDGHVNQLDLNILATRFDPAHIGGARVGPANGDFTGDNFSDMADYAMLVQNWDAGGTIPGAPLACVGVPTGPSSATVCRGGAVNLTAVGAGNAPFTYRWRKNGVLMTFVNPSAFTATLSIASAKASDQGSYDCLVTNSCATATSSAATLTVCVADYNCTGSVTVQDTFDFLAGWFAGDVRADVNGVGGTNVQDIFDFLAAWFAGC